MSGLFGQPTKYSKYVEHLIEKSYPTVGRKDQVDILSSVSAIIELVFGKASVNCERKAEIIQRAIGIKTNDIIRIEMNGPCKFLVIYRSLHYMGVKEFIGTKADVSKLINCILSMNSDVRLSHSNRRQLQ